MFPQNNKFVISHGPAARRRAKNRRLCSIRAFLLAAFGASKTIRSFSLRSTRLRTPFSDGSRREQYCCHLSRSRGPKRGQKPKPSSNPSEPSKIRKKPPKGTRKTPEGTQGASEAVRRFLLRSTRLRTPYSDGSRKEQYYCRLSDPGARRGARNQRLYYIRAFFLNASGAPRAIEDVHCVPKGLRT